MRPSPATAEYLESIAAREPRRPAFREGDATLTYGQLANVVLQAGLYLQGLGLRRGERVAVAGPGFGVQLALLLAAEALGAVTVSFHDADDPDAEFLFARVDRVFSARPQRLPPGVPFHRIDAALVARFAQPLQGAGPQWAPCDWHEPQRLSRTSGSTGAAKFMVLTRGNQEWWIRAALESWTWAMDAQTRLLLLSPLVVNAGFARASACLRQRGLVMVGSGAAIADLQPTHVLGLPVQLRALLDEIPAGWRSPHPASVATFGGTLPPALRQRAQEVFGGVAHDRYGSNEAAVLCDELDAQGRGVIKPGADVRILDEEGRELGFGQVGRIAVRSPGLVEGYIDRPEETAEAFRDGWFVSGDAGRLLSRRVLRLLGRHDDLVSIGGVKLPAAQLEAGLLADAAVRDAAVLAVHLEGGAVSLGVALVLAEGVAPQEAPAVVARAMPVAAGMPVRVVCVPALPRMASGKVDRMGLLKAMR
ncbi:MAG: class I adenylate-forming enzyme family protein [Ramlibacter sp.]